VFHAVVVTGVGAAAVIALALLTKPVFGAVLLGIEVALGIWVLWRRARGAPPGNGGRRQAGARREQL
jgi:hypothetical protein